MKLAYTRSRSFKYDFDKSYTINGVVTHKDTAFTATDTKSGQRVENWKKLISDGNAATSPYSRTAYRVTATPSSVSCKGYFTAASSVRRDITTVGVINGNQSISSLSVSSPESKALSKLYDSIRDKQSGMNGLLILGEIRETIKMLRRPGESLLNLFNNYLGTAKGLRKKWQEGKGGRNRKQFERSAADLWLEYSFGWKPLISDCQDLARTVARIATDNALRTDRARGWDVSFNAQSEPPTFGDDLGMSEPGFRFLNLRKRYSEISLRYVAGINASTYGPVDTFRGVARETGFTLDNFVPTVWNLIPYSFLFDYFVNIGDCIDAVFTDTSGVKWYCRSERRLDETHLSTRFDPKATASAYTASGYTLQSSTSTDGKVDIIRTSLTRTGGTQLPIPSLTVSLPAVNSSKYWNMFALWRGKAAGAHRP
jgi:hypothetical protein